MLMTRKLQLQTVSEVVDAFGGPKAMCAIFGGGPSRFCNYKAAGKFPDSMHMRIYVEAHERGLNVAPELVGMSADVARRLSVKPLDQQFTLPALSAE